MSALARVALAPLSGSQDPTPMNWALLAALRKSGCQVQVFHDQASFPTGSSAADHISHAICGQSPRYLDSWLMSDRLCQEVFSFGMTGADFGLVLGQFHTASQSVSPRPASLEPLCDWLDLPRILIVDASEEDPCLIPRCPPNAAGVLLDRVPRGKFIELQTAYEAIWGVPVLGGLPQLPELHPHRLALEGKNQSPCDVCNRLGDYLSVTMRWKKFWEIAHREWDSLPPKIFHPGSKLRGLRVAVGLDEAIHQYYPAVLDLLELQGATVEDFSLLKDPALPAGVDVVYLGGGPVERYAGTLAQNQCLTLALRNHVRQGGRIYAEGAGTALLCQQLRFPDGQQFPMLGVLPAVATFDPDANNSLPAELTLAEDHWLGGAGDKLRGYRDQRWQLDFTDVLQPLATDNHQTQLFGWQQVAASLVHINFALQPGFLNRFATRGAAVS